MPNIDYSQMNAQMSALGAKRGKAEGQIQKQRDRQARKVRMEQRYAQLAQDKAKHANELAKTKYAEVTAAKVNEDQAWSQAKANGTIMEDGRYTEKHWKQKAFHRYVNAGVKRTTEDMANFYANEDFLMKEEMRGAEQGMTRKYAGGDIEGNLKRKLEYNHRVEAQEGSREFFEGAEGSINRGIDSILGTGEQPIEGPELTGFDPATKFNTFSNENDSSRAPAGADIDYGKVKETKKVMLDDNGEEIMVSYSDKLGYVVADGASGFKRVDDLTRLRDASGGGSPRLLTAEQQKHDVNQELRDKFSNGNKVIRLTKSIVALSGVNTSALSSTIPASAHSFFGTEWEQMAGDEKSQKNFMNGKIQAILRAEADISPETYTEISANMGALDSQKLFLAYAMVRIQRGSGRFTGQELNTTLEAFKSNNLAYSLAAVSHAYDEAQKGVKKDVKSMAAEATVGHLFGGKDERTKSQLLSSFNTEPIQDDDGSWTILVRPEDREKLGFRFIEVTPDGGIDYIK